MEVLRRISLWTNLAKSDNQLRPPQSRKSAALGFRQHVSASLHPPLAYPPLDPYLIPNARPLFFRYLLPLVLTQFQQSLFSVLEIKRNRWTFLLFEELASPRTALSTLLTKVVSKNNHF